MTSTTYSENRMSEFKQGKAIYLWTLRKNLKLLVAYIVLLVMSLPVIQLVFGREVGITKAEQILFMDAVYPSVFSAFAVMFTLICGTVMFSYLHNKRSLDLFASLPASRRTQFFARFLSAFTLSWVPVTAVTLMSVVLCLIYTPAGITAILNGFIWLTVSMLVNLSMIAFLAVCAGSVADVIVSYLAISAAWPLIILVFYGMPGMVIPGYYDSLSSLNMVLLSAISPFVSSFIGRYYYKAFFMSEDVYVNSLRVNSPSGVPYLIWWIAFTVIAIVGCALLLKRRKNECAQTSFAFSAPEIIIRILCNFISGVGVGMLFALFSSSAGNLTQLIWFCIGAILGSMAAHLILQLIYEHRFSGFARSLIYYGISIVTALAFAFTLVTGWFGTDVYVPAAEEVEQVEVQLRIAVNNDLGVEQSSFETDTITFNDPEDIEKVIALHSAITDNLGERYKKPYSIIGEDEYTPETYSYAYDEYGNISQTNLVQETTIPGKSCERFTVRYSINGKVVSRNYYYALNTNAEITAAFEDLVSSTDMVKRSMGLYQIKDAPYYDSDDPIIIEGFSVKPRVFGLASRDYYESPYYSDENYFTSYQRLKIAEALRKDLEEKEDILEYVNRNYDNDKRACIEIFYRDNAYYYDTEYIYIDESFTNTLEALEIYSITADMLFKVQYD